MWTCPRKNYWFGLRYAMQSCYCVDMLCASAICMRLLSRNNLIAATRTQALREIKPASWVWKTNLILYTNDARPIGYKTVLSPQRNTFLWAPNWPRSGCCCCCSRMLLLLLLLLLLLAAATAAAAAAATTGVFRGGAWENAACRSMTPQYRRPQWKNVNDTIADWSILLRGAMLWRPPSMENKFAPPIQIFLYAYGCYAVRWVRLTLVAHEYRILLQLCDVYHVEMRDTYTEQAPVNQRCNAVFSRYILRLHTSYICRVRTPLRLRNSTFFKPISWKNSRLF